MDPLNVLIADDHPLILTGLADLVRSAMPDASLALSDSGANSLQTVSAMPLLDIAIVDLFMQDMDGFQFLRKLCNIKPETPVLVMSASTDKAHIQRAFDCGAAGYLPKTVSQEVFLSAINTVLAGGVFVPPESLMQGTNSPNGAAINSTENPGGNQAASLRGESYTSDGVRSVLTERQQQILGCLKAGSTNKQIARDYDLSENTVKAHVSAILHALKLNNRTEASWLAEKLGL